MPEPLLEPDANSASAARPESAYDLAAILVASFGRALPWVVVIVLACGAGIYLLSQYFHSQTRHLEQVRELNDLRVRALSAEAAASSAAATARMAALTESQEQVRVLNERLLDLARKFQDLNVNQLEGMKRFDELSRKHYAETEAARQISVTKLEQEMEASTTRLRDARLLEYRRLSELMARVDLQRDGSGADLIGLLQAQFDDPIARKQATKDATNLSTPWRARMVLMLELYRYSPERVYLQGIADLLREHRAELSQEDGRVFSTYSVMLGFRAANLAPLAAEVALDEQYPIGFRLPLFNAIFSKYYADESAIPTALGKLQLDKLTDHVKGRVKDLARDPLKVQCGLFNQFAGGLLSINRNEFIQTLRQVHADEQTTSEMKPCVESMLQRALLGGANSRRPKTP